MELTKFYINGKFTDPLSNETLEIINPATEEEIGIVALGSVEDVDREIDAWWRRITDHECPGWPRPEALSTNGIVYWINFHAACPGGWNPSFDLNP